MGDRSLELLELIPIGRAAEWGDRIAEGWIEGCHFEHDCEDEHQEFGNIRRVNVAQRALGMRYGGVH